MTREPDNYVGPKSFPIPAPFNPEKLPPPGRGSLPDHDGSDPLQPPRWIGPVYESPLRLLIAVAAG